MRSPIMKRIKNERENSEDLRNEINMYLFVCTATERKCYANDLHVHTHRQKEKEENE